MKSSIAAVFLLTLLASGPAPGDAPADPPGSGTSPSSALYSRLVEKAQNGDADTDFTALRLSYAQTADYDPYSTSTRSLFDDTWKALEAKDCQTALTKSTELLKLDFTRIVIHAMRSDCFGRLGDSTNASRELIIGRGLAASLLSSGDGKSPASAFVVVTLNEEGFVLRDLGVTQSRQALITRNGHEYDEIDGVDKSGRKASVYFEVSNLFAGLSRQLDSNPAR